LGILHSRLCGRHEDSRSSRVARSAARWRGVREYDRNDRVQFVRLPNVNADASANNSIADSCANGETDASANTATHLRTDRLRNFGLGCVFGVHATLRWRREGQKPDNHTCSAWRHVRRGRDGCRRGGRLQHARVSRQVCRLQPWRVGRVDRLHSLLRKWHKGALAILGHGVRSGLWYEPREYPVQHLRVPNASAYAGTYCCTNCGAVIGTDSCALLRTDFRTDAHAHSSANGPTDSRSCGLRSFGLAAILGMHAALWRRDVGVPSHDQAGPIRRYMRGERNRC
jgi:hypothetical protein